MSAAEFNAASDVRWRIITGDCLEVMPGLEAGSIRLVFADPPYNQGVDYGEEFFDAVSPESYLAWCQVWIQDATRLLAPDGSFWLLISHEWAWQLIPMAVRAGLSLRQTLIWYEKFGANCTRKFNRCSRSLLWLVKNPNRFVFNDCPEIRRESDRQKKYNDKRANPAGKFWDDIWGIDPEIPRLAGTHKERMRGFPTQLPIKLLRPIIGCASDPGDLVLDPFAGSGTSGQAAVEMSRRYIGIERSDLFAARAQMRLDRFAVVTPH